jgi:hypothetical protein
LAIGEKFWEGKGKNTGMAIKAVSADGVSIEATWMAQLKGVGRAKGFDGAVTFTGNVMMGPSGAGWSHGQGMFNFLIGDMAVVKGSGYGKTEAGKRKTVGLWSFMTMSQKLGWMNTVVALVTMEGDPMGQEFELTVYEWM